MSSLPPELYTEVLQHVPSIDLQQTVYALSRALPYYSAYLCHNHLFTHVHLRFSHQVLRLYLYLREHSDRIGRIQTFTLSSWQVDANIVINLVKLLPEIQEITLCIGINFSPEHLDELFERPMMMLKFLGLRFRPYVEHATYIQFLKGTYFDSVLKLLSTWPSSNIPSISIIQDPASSESKQDFAQPLVFFRLDSFARLVRSPYMESVTNFRLRIPSRSVAKHIYTYPGCLPSLDLLDLSTCYVSEFEVDELLVRFNDLRHLILDDCNVLRGEWREGDWAILGKSCALAGAKRSKKREKKIKEWQEKNSITVDGVQTMMVVQAQRPIRKAKKGRRGLAMPTITLREKGNEEGSGTAVSATGVDVPKIRMLHSLPSLVSFATTTHPSIGEDGHSSIRREFASGWLQGLKQLSAMRKRILQSYANGVRIVREDSDNIVTEEVGLEGLVDLVAGDEDLIALNGDELLELLPCPVLCFAGSHTEGHTDGCGHHLDSQWIMADQAGQFIN